MNRDTRHHYLDSGRMGNPRVVDTCRIDRIWRSKTNRGVEDCNTEQKKKDIRRHAGKI